MKKFLKRGLLSAMAFGGFSSCAPANIPEDNGQETIENVIEFFDEAKNMTLQADVEPLETKPYTLNDEKNNPSKKYGIVVVGSSRGERGWSLTDPIDKNGFWLGGVSNFKNMKEMDFDQLYILYADGKPDFSEKVEKETIQYLKKHKFKGKAEWHMATIANLEKLINKVAKVVDRNDVFVLSINTHGNPVILEMADGAEIMAFNELNELASRVKPGFGLLYVDACHSGAFIDRLNLDDYVIVSATGDHTYGWGDRGFSSSRYFFNNLMDQESDFDVDGRVTVGEAFKATVDDSLRHMARIDHYLLSTYNWDEGGAPEELIKQMSVVPEIKVGKNVSLDFYFFDSWYFMRK